MEPCYAPLQAFLTCEVFLFQFKINDMLLGAQKKMQQLGEMKVIHVCEDIMEVFEMTGFADILTIE